MNATDPVILSYDGSEEAKAAIKRAAGLFGERPAIVISVWQRAHAAHSYAWPGVSLAPDHDTVDATNARIAEGIADEGARLAAVAGLTADAIAVRAVGPVWEAILISAGEFRAAAIVLGSRGLSGVKSRLLGSVSTGVVHHATRPTLVVRHGAPADTTGPLIVAYDGSEDARLAIERAAALFRARPVLVVTAWQHPAAHLVYGTPGAVYIPEVEALDTAAEEAAVRVAAEGAQLAVAAGLDAEPVSFESPGPVWEAILTAADKHHAAAIVTGSRGLSGIRSLMLGSVSNSLLHHTHRPTLVVRHGAGDAAAAGRQA